MRRFGAWHSYKIQHYANAIACMVAHDGSWVNRGREALLKELLQEWTNRRNRLPPQIRGTTPGGDFNNLTPGGDAPAR